MTRLFCPVPLLALAALVTLSACKKADDAPASSAGAGVPVATLPKPAPPTSGGTRYTFDQSNSKITWVGKKVTGKHDGAFQTFSGAADVNVADLSKSSVAVVIDMSSITTDNERLIKHLKTPDFFDVAKHPHAKFTSTSITPIPAGSGAATHTVAGNLEIKGVSKPVSFPATIKLGDAGAELDGEMTINRQDFGVAYKGKPDDLVEDNVTIKLELRAKKEG